LKLCNIMFSGTLIWCLPTQFVPFASVCDSTCCAAKECIQLSSMSFLCTCTGLQDHSDNVRHFSETVYYSCRSVMQILMWLLETEEVLQTEHGGVGLQLLLSWCRMCSNASCQGNEEFTCIMLLLTRTLTCWHAEKSGALRVVLNICCSNPDFFDAVWFSNESWFHLLGYLNSQSACVWAAANFHVLSSTENRDVVCYIMYLHNGPIC
jgi:hypothetical protein